MSDQEDTEQTPRRRSTRIIALEKKREREKKARDEARKNCPDYKGKGKAVLNGEEDYELIDDEDGDEEDDEYAPNKKRGRKSRPLNQLFSLTQPIQEGQYTEYSRTHGLPRALPKETLEFVLDLLQSKLRRQDPDELFAQPVNPDQDYHRIVKEPMDIGTMRAKVHENMYTTFEQFKRDVYLICSNAMNVNPSSTTSHKVAKAINDEASRVFHALSADPEFFDMCYFGLDKKKSRARKSHARSKSSGHRPRKLSSKPGGGNSGANNSMGAEVDKRQTYRPTGGDSIFSEVLDGPKSNLQFHKPSCYYQDSLARFVEDMGPTVKKFAASKIESFRKYQSMCGEATRPNPLANFLDTTENIIGPTSTLPPRPPPPPPRPPRPPTAATRRSHDAPRGVNYPNISNRPLTIPGFTAQAPQETRNINIDRTGDYKGKNVAVDSQEKWEAYAASILSSYFMNSEGGLRGRGPNLNGEGSSSSGNMAPSFHQNRSPFRNISSSFQAANQNQNQNQGMQWNDRPEASNARNTVRNVTPSEFTQVRVWPSIVITGAEAQYRPTIEPIRNYDRQVPFRPQDQSLLSRRNLVRQEQEATQGQNLSEPSLLSQNLTEFDFTLLRQALWSQQIPAEQANAGNNKFTWQSFMPQQIPQEAMNLMNGYNNSSGNPLLSQPSISNSNPIMMNGYNTLSGGGQSFMSQQRPEDVGIITEWQSFLPQSDSITCQSFMHLQKPQDALMAQAQAQAVAGYYESLSQQVANWNEERPSNLYNLGNNTHQPDEFQTIWAPIDLNTIPITDNTSIYTAPPVFIDNSGDLLLMQPEPGQLNPLGLFARQIPRPPSSSSSASLEMPMDLNAMNYYVDNAMVGQSVAGGGEGPSTAQLQRDDGRQPNLALQL